MKIKDIFESYDETTTVQVDHYVEPEDVEPVAKGGPVVFNVAVSPVVDPERRGDNWYADYNAEIVGCECDMENFDWKRYLKRFPRVDDNIKERAVEYARQGVTESTEYGEEKSVDLEINGNYIVPVTVRLDAEPEFSSMSNSNVDKGYVEIILQVPVKVGGKSYPAGRPLPTEQLLRSISAVGNIRLRKPLSSRSELERLILSPAA